MYFAVKWHNYIMTWFPASGLEPPVQLQGRQKGELQPKMCQQDSTGLMCQSKLGSIHTQQFLYLLFISFVSWWTGLSQDSEVFLFLFCQLKSLFVIYADSHLKLVRKIPQNQQRNPKLQNLQDSESFVKYSICYQILPAFVKQFKWLLQLTCSKCF